MRRVGFREGGDRVDGVAGASTMWPVRRRSRAKTTAASDGDVLEEAGACGTFLDAHALVAWKDTR